MSELPYEEICLAAIGDNQGAVRQVDYALKQVMKNIADPNTDPKKKRSVTLKIIFDPEPNRKSANIEYSVDAKLAGDMPGADHVTISNDGTGFVPMMEQLELKTRPLEAREGGER